MHYYKTTLRLSGSTMNEVVKTVSAPELLILQYIHGPDACTRVEEIKNEKVNLFGEKDRLKRLYNSALARQEQSIDNIFGALGTLPERLQPELLERFDIYDDPLAEYDRDEEVKILEKTAKKILEKTAKSHHTTISDAPDMVTTQFEADNLNRIAPIEDVNVADLMG